MKNSWRLILLLGLVALCSALSCSADRMASSDSVAAAMQELTSTQVRVLSFEGVAGSGGDWATSNVKLQSGTEHADGTKSAQFAVTGSSATLTSVPLASLGPISNQVTLSIWLPAYLTGLSYQGQVGLHLNSPTAGVFGQYYGPVLLTNGSPTRTWQQVKFALRAADVSALSTRTYSDLVVTLDLTFNPNPAFNASNPFADPGYVDALSFGSTGSGGAAGSAGASGSAGKSGSAGTSGIGGSAGRSGSAGTSAGAGASSTGTSGPCSFSAAPAGIPNTPFTFSIQLPHGVQRGGSRASRPSSDKSRSRTTTCNTRRAN